MTKNVSLTPELEAYAAEKVEAGLYGSFSEVVRAALREMMLRERAAEEARDWLRERIREGDDSGDPVPFDAERIKKRGRTRLANRNAG